MLTFEEFRKLNAEQHGEEMLEPGALERLAGWAEWPQSQRKDDAALILLQTDALGEKWPPWPESVREVKG